jgi:large subunit ribosomal protein L29
MAKKQKLKELSPAQLERKITEMEEDLRELRFKKIVASIDSPADIPNLRREIARARTYVREYDLGIFKFEDMKRVKVED